MKKNSGKYVTEIDLKEKKWTSEMIENSKAWAKANNCHRISKIHGCEEWSLPLDDEFTKLQRQKETTESTTSVAVQDCLGHNAPFYSTTFRAKSIFWFLSILQEKIMRLLKGWT